VRLLLWVVVGVNLLLLVALLLLLLLFYCLLHPVEALKFRAALEQSTVAGQQYLSAVLLQAQVLQQQSSSRNSHWSGSNIGPAMTAAAINTGHDQH
jgi:hypothetical protein